jgi:hypothetical protein
MSLPEGSEPSSVRLSRAQRHASSCRSRPAVPRSGMAAPLVVTRSLAALVVAARAAGPGDRRVGRSDAAPSAARQTWRSSSSYAAIRENDGHAAITRPVIVGSATATLAARLATLPAASSAYGRDPPRPPPRESANCVVEAATIIPSTDSGVSAATHPAAHAARRAGACAGRRPSGDQRQQSDAPDRDPPDPIIGPPGHCGPPSANSPTSTHYGCNPPRTHRDHELTWGYAIGEVQDRSHLTSFPQVRAIGVQVGSRLRNGHEVSAYRGG